MREWMNEPRDERPVICQCEQCGEPIHGGNYTHFGDVYYRFDSIAVHEECVMDYLNENCRRED